MSIKPSAEWFEGFLDCSGISHYRYRFFRVVYDLDSLCFNRLRFGSFVLLRLWLCVETYFPIFRRGLSVIEYIIYSTEYWSECAIVVLPKVIIPPIAAAYSFVLSCDLFDFVPCRSVFPLYMNSWVVRLADCELLPGELGWKFLPDVFCYKYGISSILSAWLVKDCSVLLDDFFPCSLALFLGSVLFFFSLFYELICPLYRLRYFFIGCPRCVKVIIKANAEFFGNRPAVFIQTVERITKIGLGIIWG